MLGLKLNPSYAEFKNEYSCDSYTVLPPISTVSVIRGLLQPPTQKKN
jgi:hypothetical protein